MMKLGKFEKVELRECWRTEDKDFTPWLAKPENIEILSETIGITLEVQGVEQGVGPFRADILCVDADSFESDGKHYILIENQLEITDHKHLGQLMTYAAGLDAVTLIWISSKFTEEHRAALDWLNRITDETFKFFGIEIEVYRIGDSLPAPRFNIVAKPNDWSKNVKKNTTNRELSEKTILIQEYWQRLKDYTETKRSFLKIRKSSRFYTTAFKFDKNSAVDFSIHLKTKEICVYFWVNGENHEVRFDKIKEKFEEQLAQDFGHIIWIREHSRGNWSSISLVRKADFTNNEDWENQFQWFVESGEKFANLFKSEIEKL